MSKRIADENSYTQPTGVMLAVQVPVGRESEASVILREEGGENVERANGRWVGGKWMDGEWLNFDQTPPSQSAREVARGGGDLQS